MKDIIARCNNFYRADVKSRGRDHNTAKARHVCWFLLREKGYKLAEIADEWGYVPCSVSDSIASMKRKVAMGLVELPYKNKDRMKEQRVILAVDAAWRHIRPIMIREVLKGL